MATALRIIDESPGVEKRPAATLYLASESMTARELVKRRIEQEVATYNKTQGDVFRGLVQPADAERVLNGFKLAKRRRLDPDQQFQAALDAFESNGFLLLFDDRQVESLDETVTISSTSVATFIRLVPLMGG